MESRTEHFKIGAASNEHLMSVMNMHSTSLLHEMNSTGEHNYLQVARLAKGVGALRKTYHPQQLAAFTGTPQRSVMSEGSN